MIERLSKFKRFSMCNCVTVRMEKYAKRRQLDFVRTYTAHTMTTDLFLKKVNPGVRFSIPYSTLWPKGYITYYQIPKKIQTFLFSPFNETLHPSYVFNDGIRYVIPMDPSGKTDIKFNKLREKATKILRLTVDQFIDDLYKLEKKVNTIWNNPLKLLLFYDHSTAKTQMRKRAALFNAAAKETLKWETIQISEPNKKNKQPHMWPHYSGATYVWVLKQIERIESTCDIKN